MKSYRMLAWLVAIAVLFATASSNPGVSRIPTAHAQSAELGVFAFSELDWGDSGEPAGDYVLFREEGVDFWVEFDGDTTVFVEMVFAAPLDFNIAEEFVQNDMLPDDVELYLEYDRIMVADGDPQLFIQLYESGSLYEFSRDTFGYILVTYLREGQDSDISRVSLTVGEMVF